MSGEAPGRDLGGTLGTPLGNVPKPQILENKVTKTEGKSRLGVHQRSRKVAFYSVFFHQFCDFSDFFLQKHVFQNHRNLQGSVIFIFPHVYQSR